VSNQRILVVDDDPKVVKFVKEYLEARGYYIHTAGNGWDALNIVKTESPDLVILDVMLPGIDGFEVCRQVKEFSTIPIIMISARDSIEDKRHGLSLGACDYITKPFDVAELMVRIGTVLNYN
jgi:DNA-binding response OmpR family regulator